MKDIGGISPHWTFFSFANLKFSKTSAHSIFGKMLSIAPLDVATAVEMATESLTFLVEQRLIGYCTMKNWRHRSLVIRGSGQTGGWHCNCFVIVWRCSGSTVSMNMHFNVVHGLGWHEGGS